MGKWSNWLGGVAAAALVVASLPASAQTPIKFTLDWVFQGPTSPFLVALDKGYYKAKGLDVTLENSKGSGDSIAKVDTGRADAGLADAAVVIASNARGTTIKTVGMVFDKTPLNIFSLKSNALLKPKDLEGKSLGAPPGDSQRQMFPAFAKVNGIDVSKVTWVNIEPAAKIAAVAEKRMDGVGDYSTGLPLYEKADGKGNQEMGAPNLTDGIWLYGGDHNSVYRSIFYARNGSMPAWGQRLDDATLKMLAIYVHSLGGGK